MANPDSSPTDRRAFLSTAPEATEALASALGAALGPGCVLALAGDLGAGKTTFVRGLARGLGVRERVHSPTFTLMHVYEGRLPVYHFDAWMEGRERAFLAEGGAEELGGDGVAVVEWAARVSEWLPQPHLEVRLGHRGLEERSVELALVGDASAPPGPVLRAALAGLGASEGVRELSAQELEMGVNPPSPGALEGQDRL